MVHAPSCTGRERKPGMTGPEHVPVAAVGNARFGRAARGIAPTSQRCEPAGSATQADNT